MSADRDLGLAYAQAGVSKDDIARAGAVVEQQERRQRSGQATDKRHRCPPWCHKCPDLIEIVVARGGDPKDPIEYTMPGCMGGAYYGIEGCCCAHRAAKEMRAEERMEAIRRLRDLIQTFPDDARRLLAENDADRIGTVRLRSVSDDPSHRPSRKASPTARQLR